MRFRFGSHALAAAAAFLLAVGGSVFAQDAAPPQVIETKPVLAPLASPGAEAGELAAEPQIDVEAVFRGETALTPAGLKAMQERMQELAAKLMPSVVGVQVGPSQGSGVVVDKDGTVLTAAHVNGGVDRNTVFLFHDGSRKRGKTLGANKGNDSGMMKIETDKDDLVPVELGDSAELKQGQWVVALGHPGGYMSDRKPVLRLGRILSISRNTIVTDCTLVGGDSGGPLFDMDGKLIGIHSRIGGSLAANMHVPVNAYVDTWDDLAASKEWGSDRDGGPFIGVRGAKEAENALIEEVYPGAPAEQAGMQPGDVIVEFNGDAVKNFRDLAAAVRKTEPGDEVVVKVERDGETVELTMIVGKSG